MTEEENDAILDALILGEPKKSADLVRNEDFLSKEFRGVVAGLLDGSIKPEKVEDLTRRQQATRLFWIYVLVDGCNYTLSEQNVHNLITGHGLSKDTVRRFHVDDEKKADAEQKRVQNPENRSSEAENEVPEWARPLDFEPDDPKYLRTRPEGAEARKIELLIDFLPPDQWNAYRTALEAAYRSNNWSSKT